MQTLSRRSLLKIASASVPCYPLLPRIEALASPPERVPVNDTSLAHPRMELLRHGADRTALNAEGKNAANIAREAGHDELAAIFERN